MEGHHLEKFDATMSEHASLETLSGFFRQHVPAAAQTPLTPETALLGTGLLDSLAVIQLMVFLGQELGIEIDDDDFTPDNLGTVGQLLAFIERKKAG
jgi:acyl carrier protein